MPYMDQVNERPSAKRMLLVMRAVPTTSPRERSVPQRRIGSQENGQHDIACRSFEDLGCLGEADRSQQHLSQGWRGQEGLSQGKPNQAMTAKTGRERGVPPTAKWRIGSLELDQVSAHYATGTDIPLVAGWAELLMIFCVVP